MTKAMPTTTPMQSQPSEEHMPNTKKEYTFNMRKELHEFRTNGFKLACGRDGKLYPMVDYNEFMADPDKAVERWHKLPNYKPAKRKAYYQTRRSAHRVCYAPAPGMTS